MFRRLSCAATALALLGGCGGSESGLTQAEAWEAVEEISTSSQALNVASGTVEIATNFTTGQAVQAAAEELRDFIESQLPCAEITLDGATLTVEYGVHPGNCTYHGLSYTGTHEIAVTRNDDGDVLVEHAWTELSNGRMAVSGEADVTWSFVGGSRHVVHELSWTRLIDERQAQGSGDRLQTALEGGIAVGFQEEGSRSWHGQSGLWELDNDGVEMRWIDPAPQAGVYTLDTPFDKAVTVSFVRLDPVTIQVTISDGVGEFQFNLRSL